MVDEHHGKRFWFACNKWIGSTADDGGVRVRTLTVCKEDPRANFSNYRVSGSRRSSG